MKHFVFLLLTLAGFFVATNATVYYSQGSGAPNLLSIWNSSRNGSGTAPSGFLGAGDQFVIQANHVLYTNSVWAIGSTGSQLTIETGGILHAAHAIQLTGTFQIMDGGTYYHDNTGPVTSAAGSSIFGGVESFSAGSNVEIRNWINNNTTLPAGISWGNLTINYTTNIGGNWNQLGALTSILGNFSIKGTGTSAQSFRLTNNSNLVLNIGGSLIIDRGSLFIKEGSAAGTTSVVQVNGDIFVNDGGTLDLGTADFKPNNELRFKGNLFVTANALLNAQSAEPMLIANSGGVQAVYTESTINSGLKIVSGAMIKLASPLTIGTGKALVVSGMLNAGTNAIKLGGGILAVSGGILNSNAKIDLQDGFCQICQGNGTFSIGNNWCSTTGDTGVINFTTDTILFNRSLASAIKIGALNSKGKLFLSNSAVLGFLGPQTGPAPNRGSIELTGNGTLSFDENSIAAGDALYNATGGLLVIGGTAGLQGSGPFGNMQITGSRNYNMSGVNSYEFKSSLPQFTGAAFPSTVNGVLRINNGSISGVILSNPVTITSTGTLHLQRGIFQTSSFFLPTLNHNSSFIGGSATAYVSGPLRKVGNQNFTFHIGKSGRYSPVNMIANGSATVSDFYTAEYFPGDPKSFYGNNLSQLIEKLSSVEYWLIVGTDNRFRQLRFPITPYSGVNDFPTLTVAFYDGGGWINLSNWGNTGNTNNGTILTQTSFYGPFTLASTNAMTNPFNASLPVNILSFSARRHGSNALLDWAVSADTEAEYFEVLASFDNRTFTPIAKLKSEPGKLLYQYTDAFLQPGTKYYRIRVVEKNGNAVLSKIAAVLYQKKGIELVSAAPSIVRSQTSIAIASSDRATVQLSLVDAQGRLVKQTMVNLVQGTSNVTLDMSSLGSGFYYLHAISGEERTNVLRLVKQ